MNTTEVTKASTVDAMWAITHICEAIQEIDSSATWCDNFPTRVALWEVLEATLNAFYEKGVPLANLSMAITVAGWDEKDNHLEIVKGKVKIV
jgi:adenylate kinase family enzyme